MRVLRICAVTAVLAFAGLAPGLLTPTSAAGSGYTLSIVAGSGTQGAATAGSATSSAMHFPEDVAVDASGNLYIADGYNHVVEKVTPGGTLSIIAGNGTVSPAPTPGPATSVGLGYITGVAVDSAGNVYIADPSYHAIEKVTPGGTLSFLAGGTLGTPTPGPAAASGLGYPTKLAIDSADNLYFTDYADTADIVGKVTPAGTLSIIAGNGANGVPVAGPATSASFDYPSGIAVDAGGNVYVSDVFSKLVVKVTPGGALTIVAGNGTSVAPTPGPATDSSVGNVYDVAIDSSGNLLIADIVNSVVDKVTPAGVLSVIAGTGASGLPVPGPATASSLKVPQGLAADSAGNIYIADTVNNVVEKLTPTAVVVTVTAPSPTYPLGAAIPTSFTPTYSGYAEGDAPTTPPTCTSTAHTGSPLGSYPVTCTGGDANSGENPYTFAYQPGTLTIRAPHCSDSVDNDENGITDFPQDLGCTNALDDTEAAAQACPAGAPIFGTNGGDDLVGTAGSDSIYGGGGIDSLDGRGGADCLYGQDGIDTLTGGTGNDQLWGGAALDFLYGEAGYDTLYGGDGVDYLSGGSNDDRLNGGPGVDRLSGGAGNDRIVAVDGGIDTVNCGTGAHDVAIVDHNDIVTGCEVKVVLQ